ncbi:unnamed protein product [Chironomus riparius]|uniref:Uncharacterized protein n=1 Tax=Chironomus riparius TaxID=315576 RepID=A0A9N9RNG9_9DIPT|nr:unnamed protein product [Chironomus riparius]
MSENCRFCLKILDFTEKFHEINNDIKYDFKNVTQMELLTSECYINIVCELCLRSLQLASTLKKQLIENQEKFYKDYEYATKFDDDFQQPTKRSRKRKSRTSQVSEDEKAIDMSSVASIKQENPLENAVIIDLQPLNQDPESFVCKICNKPFKNKLRLRKHKITHSTDKKIVCTACGKKFKRNENLKAHMLHHEDPKFQCDVCGRYYFDKSSLHHHIKSNHLQTRDYHCQYCSKSYFKISNLNRHILSIHQNQKFLCGVETCGKAFNYKHHCKIHITRMHRSVKFEDIEGLIKYNLTKPFLPPPASE